MILKLSSYATAKRHLNRESCKKEKVKSGIERA